MAANIEIKALVRDVHRLRQLAESISDTPCEMLRQQDVFFNIPEGRLKLRILAPDYGQLIYYQRRDRSGPKQSDYEITHTAEPETLCGVLDAALGRRGVVTKTRLLYHVANTRIHLDEVEGLGHFMELEFVMGAGRSAAQGEQVVARLLKELEIEASDLVDVAYIDLLEAQGV